jgi:hypothetical protein
MGNNEKNQQKLIENGKKTTKTGKKPKNPVKIRKKNKSENLPKSHKKN